MSYIKAGASSGTVQSPERLLSSAAALWYFDQYQTTNFNPCVPNVLAATPPTTNILLASRRNFWDYGYPGCWTWFNTTGTDNNATALDGSLNATTISHGSGNWRIYQSARATLPNGQYTIGCSVRWVSGDTQFYLGQPFATTSGALTATATLQRFSVTITQTSDNPWGIHNVNASGSGVLEISDLTLYPGAVDLGAEALAGHLYIKQPVNVVNTNGLLTINKAGFTDAYPPGSGIIQLPAVYTTDNLTTMAVVRPEALVPTTGLNYLQGWLSRIDDDAFWVGDYLQVGPGYSFGQAGGGSLTCVGETLASNAPFHLARVNLSVVCHRWNKSTLTCDSWVNGVQLALNIGGSAAFYPTLQDFYFAQMAHADHPCSYSFNSLALWTRTLSDVEVAAAGVLLAARSAQTGNIIG